MNWRMFLPNRPQQAVITQAMVGGSLKVPGVVSFTTQDSQLMGMNESGKVIMVVPLAQVAAAVIDEVSK